MPFGKCYDGIPHTKMLPERKNVNLISALANNEVLGVQEYKGCRGLKIAGLERSIALP